MADGPAASYPPLDDPDLTLARMMQVWPGTIAVFIGYRMTCAGCPVSRFHSIEDACRIHDIATDEFRDALGRTINSVAGPR